MSNTVDNRVVELGFDNKQFESGVKQSTSTLDSLKKSLNLDEASKSLLNLNAAGKKFNIGNISEGVQNVSNRFSTLGIIGMTVIQNLTTAALNYGKKIADNLLRPMKSGLQEYETQMNAVQTIMANTAAKGTTLDQVNAALDELNTYADKTIYNFTEMTRNIGTFTAAGVELETSVSAIKGIANLAAVSGSNSQQAATAMYQLSQALASGTVKLMDWNSVVNAGMGGQVFQDALKETARNHGIAVDDMITKSGSFRESLKEGWLDTSVLLDTLAKFTGDLSEETLRSMGYTEEQVAQIIKLGETANDAATKVKTLTQLKDTIQEALGSGWAQTWKIIIGDFEEAKALFTEMSDIIGPMIQQSSDARNFILEQWKQRGGRDLVIESLRNSFEALLKIAAPIKEAFRDIFPALDGKDLWKMSLALKDFTEKLSISGETADKIKRIFKGLFAGLDIVRQVGVELAKVFFDLFSTFAPGAGGGILDFLANLGDYVVNFRESIDVTQGFRNAVTFLKEAFNSARVDIGAFINVISGKFEEFRQKYDYAFMYIRISLKKFWLNVKQTFRDIEKAFGGFGDQAKKLKIRFKPFETLFKGLVFLIGGLLSLAKTAAPTFFKLTGAIGKFLKGIGEAIYNAIANADFAKIFDVINSGLIAAILLAIRKFITSGSGFIDEASGVFGGITGILDGVRGSLEAWQQNLRAKTLLLIASAIGILTLSLVILAGIDSKKLTVALGVVTAMMVQLIAAQAALSGVGGSVKTSTGLIAFAIALFIMATALSKLGALKPEELDQGLGAVFALSAGMAALSAILSRNSGSFIKGAISLVGISIAMLLLTSVVRRLGELKPEELTRGLQGVGVMLAEIAIFMKLVNSSNMGVSSGAGLILLAASLMIIALTVEKFANMDAGKIQQGITALGVLLAELGIFTRITGSGANLIAVGVGMNLLGASLLIFADVVNRLGSMDLGALQQGLAGMGGALLIIVAAARLFPNNMIITGLGLIAVAVGLVIMSQALQTMGEMTWEEIGKGLLTLAGSLLILSVALYAMSGTLVGSAALLIAAAALAILTPVLVTLGAMGLAEIGIALLALAGVFILLGVAGALLTPVIPSLLGLGVSMMLIGVAAMLVGVGLLAFSLGLSAIAVSGAAAAVAIVAMISTILGVVPLIIQTLIDVIIIFGEGIIKATPVIGAAILTLLLTVLDIIIKVTPKLFKALTILLKGLIQLIVDVAPDFIKAVVLLLVTLLQEIAEKMPDFVQAGWDILIAFLEGIRDNIREVVTVVVEIVTEFLGAIADNLPDIIQSGWDLAIAFIDGMADGIDNNMEPLLKAIGRLGQAMIDGLVLAIGKGVQAVKKALKDIVDAAIQAIKERLGIASPSKVFAKIGQYIPEGLIVGIKKLKGAVLSTVKELSDSATEGIRTAFSEVMNLLTSDFDMSPTIRPVMDLSEVVSGGKIIDDIISKKAFNIIPVVARTALVASNISGTGESNGDINNISSVNFTQNNYSPKALSRLDIYRQTKNQLLTLKGLV